MDDGGWTDKQMDRWMTCSFIASLTVLSHIRAIGGYYARLCAMEPHLGLENLCLKPVSNLELLDQQVRTLLHSERPKLYTTVAFQSAIVLTY